LLFEIVLIFAMINYAPCAVVFLILNHIDSSNDQANDKNQEQEKVDESESEPKDGEVVDVDSESNSENAQKDIKQGVAPSGLGSAILANSAAQPEQKDEIERPADEQNNAENNNEGEESSDQEMAVESNDHQQAEVQEIQEDAEGDSENNDKSMEDNSLLKDDKESDNQSDNHSEDKAAPEAEAQDKVVSVRSYGILPNSH
jgi:cell division protein FtsN